MLESVLPMFSLNSCIVSGLPLRSSIYFELIFVYDVRKLFRFHSFTSGWPVFPAPLVKEIVFSPFYILASFVKDNVLVLVFKTINLISFCTVNVSVRLFKKHLLWLIKCKDCTCYYASFLSYIFSQGTCFNTFILRTFKSNSR